MRFPHQTLCISITMSLTKECNVCVENKVLFECKYCNYEVCKSCVSKYLVSSINEAECMNCHKYFDREYLLHLCGKSWYNNIYKPSRESVMFEREKTMFSESLPFVDLYKHGEKLGTMIEELNTNLKECEQKIKKYSNMKSKIQSDINKLRNTRESYARQIRTGVITTGSVKKDVAAPVKTAFYVKCAYKDCDGIVNDKSVCVKCDKQMCKKCYEPSIDNHECDENTIATIEMMKKDTKPCPSCNIPIYKISGCYQMWCTVCHITFHYNTGEILKEVIHNPHYVEWMANNSIRQGGGGDCNLYNSITRVVSSQYNKESVMNVYRMSRHIAHVLLPDAEQNITKFAGGNNIREHRVKYLVGSTNEKTYKQKLFMNYKQLSRWTDTRNYLQLIQDGFTSITMEFIDKPDIHLFRTKLENLLAFINEDSNRLASIYDNSMVSFFIVQNKSSFTIMEQFN